MSESILNNIESLIASRKSLLLATLNPKHQPEISSTPFLKDTNNFYIFISELASHTQNLKRHPSLSIMLIEDEKDTKNAFARRRLSYECQAKIIERNENQWAEILAKFEVRLGKTVSMLKSLPDFHLFQLEPISGNYIEGFGKAFKLSGEYLDKLELQTKA